MARNILETAPMSLRNMGSRLAMVASSILEAKVRLRSDGWAVLASSSTNILDVAMEFGVAVTQPGRSMVQPLVPSSRESAPPKSMSAIYGLSDFSPHTDVAHWPAPARFLILRSLLNETRTPTYLMDSHAMASNAEKKVWSRTVWKVDARTPFLCSLLSDTRDGLCIRWDPCCMRPVGALALSIASEIMSASAAALAKPTAVIQWKSTNEFLIVDNWRFLHARPAVPLTGGRRLLERVLVKERGR